MSATRRRALVTGGAGFIGSHLVERLLSEGIGVVVLDNLSTGKRQNVPPEAEFLPGDVRDTDIVAKAVKDVDTVVHLAAKVSIRASVAEFYEDAQVNLVGTLNVLKACASLHIEKFVYASSMAVYADASQPHPLPETYATEPVSPYGVSKLACEKYARLVAQQSGFQAVTLRYFNTYGPRQTYTPYVGVITIFVQRLLRGQAPIIYGDGEQCRDLVYVGDIVDCTYRAMVRDVGSDVFNVGSGVGMSVNRIAELLCARLRPGANPVHAAEQPGELRNSVADIHKAQRLLGYEPKGRIEDRLEEIIAWNQGLV